MGRVFQHEIGKRHTQNIANNNRRVDRKQKEEIRDEPESMDIAPGEPAPPGFEEISKTSQIQVGSLWRYYTLMYKLFLYALSESIYELF